MSADVGPWLPGRLDPGVEWQSRWFAGAGPNSADRWQGSTALRLGYEHDWDGGRQALRGRAFARWDSDDERRSHADLRELSWYYTAENWQLQAGVAQVFWGVVEFNHLIDVVNQTDLVENIDMEAKLGQPLAALTLFRPWGTLELYGLVGFREREFPGLEGRITQALPVLSDGQFEADADRRRFDGLIRLATALGGADLELYHFSGTRRTPRLLPATDTAGEPALTPFYDDVQQSAVSAQTGINNTAVKLEALYQSGGPQRYVAAALGIEHTLVGILGSTSDLGLVLEYHYDERGNAAFDTIFERDLAVGLRFGRNDQFDSQALFGIVWDHSTDEILLSLEAERRLNDHWRVALEGRWFLGATPVGRFDSATAIADPRNKLGAFADDDYLQLEIVRFF
ncbi:MAG: hypothetical protein AAF515_12175 [Pseudomonadota bacterium]